MADPTGNGHVEVVEKADTGLMIEVGRTGLREMGGYIYEEFLRELQGQKATRVYREMRDNDPVVAAVLFAIEMLIRQVQWRAEPSEEDTTGEWADFVWGCIGDMSSSWEDTLSEILTFLQHGWSLFETVFKIRGGPQPEESKTPTSEYDDGKIGWRKFAIRAQESLWRWEFDETGGLKGMWQQAPPTYTPTFIPIEKCVLFRTTTAKGSPEGHSVLRAAYLPYWSKRRIQEIEGIGIERDLAGLPVIEVPSKLFLANAPDADKQTLDLIKQLVRNIRRNEQEGIVMPQAFDDKGNKMYDLKLLTTGGRRQFDLDATVARYDQRMAMTVLADFILLGHERIGSQALSVSKVQLFTTAIGAWTDAIADVFNTHAIPRLLRLNGADPKLAPKLTHASIEKVDLAELGTYVLNISKAGMPLFPNIETENYLRSVGGLPEDVNATEPV